MRAEDLKEELEGRLYLRGRGLVGCRRRGQWTGDDLPWSVLSGYAVLWIVSHPKSCPTPAGPFEFFRSHDGDLVEFRGGEAKSYQVEDFYDAWALASAYSPYKMTRRILVLRENKGQLTTENIDVPEHIDYTERAEEIVEEAQADPPGRISKATHRALRTCRYCPVKQRCDATDKLRGEDDDWSTSYPIP